MAPIQFIARFLLFVCVFTLMMLAINMAVDPYLLFNAPRVEGFNARKPAVASHDRLMKQYDSVRNSARTVVLGSSRSELGINPASASWRPEDRPVYNLSLAGINPQTLIPYLRNFLLANPSQEATRTLIIGLDFEEYLHDPSDFAETKPDMPAHSNAGIKEMSEGWLMENDAFAMLKDYVSATLSLDALLASVSTVVNSIRGTGATLEPNGWMDDAVFLETSTTSGVAALFAQKNHETVMQYGSIPLVMCESFDDGCQDMSAIQEIIKMADTIGAELILFAQPAHVDRWEILGRLGYWKDLEEWKRAVTIMVDEARSAGSRVEFWDFADYSPRMQEVSPPPEDRTTVLDWFWEPAHYRSTLGDDLIAIMRNRDSVEHFGERLTSNNIEKRLLEIRRERDRYRRANPEQVRKIADMICSVRPCSHTGATAEDALTADH